MNKIEGLQLGRALAVLSVLVFHIAGLSVEYRHGCFYAPWTQVLRAGVDVFFVISGVVMVVTTWRRMEEPGTAKRFLIHRVTRIYPPYLTLTIVLAAFWIMHPAAVNANTGGVDLFASLTLWPSNRLPLVQVGWTLSFELMFYFVFFLMIAFLRRAWLPGALLLWTAAVIAGTILIGIDSSGSILRVFPNARFFFSLYVIEFVAGCFVGLAFLKVNFTAPRACGAIAMALFAAEAAAFQAKNFGGNGQLGFRVLLFGLPAVLLVYSLLPARHKGNPRFLQRWLIRCGNASYSIYLVHLPVVHFAYRYLWKPFDGPAARPLFPVFAGALALAASAVFYRGIEKPSSLWARRWLESVFRVPEKASAAHPAPALAGSSD
jgi:exopolysaccharide production protein ExoZ